MNYRVILTNLLDGKYIYIYTYMNKIIFHIAHKNWDSSQKKLTNSNWPFNSIRKTLHDIGKKELIEHICFNFCKLLTTNPQKSKLFWGSHLQQLPTCEVNSPSKLSTSQHKKGNESNDMCLLSLVLAAKALPYCSVAKTIVKE